MEFELSAEQARAISIGALQKQLTPIYSAIADACNKGQFTVTVETAIDANMKHALSLNGFYVTQAVSKYVISWHNG